MGKFTQPRERRRLKPPFPYPIFCFTRAEFHYNVNEIPSFFLGKKYTWKKNVFDEAWRRSREFKIWMTLLVFLSLCSLRHHFSLGFWINFLRGCAPLRNLLFFHSFSPFHFSASRKKTFIILFKLKNKVDW